LLKGLQDSCAFKLKCKPVQQNRTGTVFIYFFFKEKPFLLEKLVEANRKNKIVFLLVEVAVSKGIFFKQKIVRRTTLGHLLVGLTSVTTKKMTAKGAKLNVAS
jgi:hypothetical protein